jgi:hypothetical protein
MLMTTAVWYRIETVWKHIGGRRLFAYVISG